VTQADPVALFREGRHEEALPGLLAALRASPGDSAAMMYLAETLTRLNRLEQAVKLFTAATWSRPDDAMALAYLSQVKRRLGRTEEGLEDLERAVALDRSRIWMSSLGYGREPNAAFYARERENLAELLRRRPDWGLAHVALGMAEAHSSSPELKRVRARFDRGLALDPRLSWTRAWLAELCRAAGEHVAAAALLDGWLKESPGDADALLRRGESRAVTGTLAAAFKDFDRACALRPDSGSALAWRGEVKLWAGDYAGALDDCRRATEAREPFLWAHGWVGAALLMLGRGPEAIVALDEALAEDPADAEAWTWRGEAKLRAGLAKEAVADLDQALSRRELLGARLNRGLALGALGDAAGRRREYSAAVAFGPRLLARAARGAKGEREILERARELSLGNRTVLPTFASGRGQTRRLVRA
jgi:tetratricopeptide (TPR) repeat protein